MRATGVGPPLGRVRPGLAGLVGLVALGLLAGCSQAEAIAPVGGSRQALVRFAGNDVLAEKGVAVLESPVCAQTSDVITCTGTTVSGEAIVVRADPGSPATIVVTVGGRTLYSGSAQDVIDRSGRPT